MRAMTVAVPRVRVLGDEVVASFVAGVEFVMERIDPGIDHCDFYRFPLRRAPGVGGVHLVDAPGVSLRRRDRPCRPDGSGRAGSVIRETDRGYLRSRRCRGGRDGKGKGG